MSTMMADGASSEAYVKEEADFQQPNTAILNDLSNHTNGEHKKMERERVKKKAPGKAVIMTGASAHPPTNDEDMSDAKEYVMQYTDIFAPEGDSNLFEDDGGEIVESSDTEIVGHSEENSHYAKGSYDDDSDDDDDDDISHEGPPPLDSGDDYEYDDSDLGFSPPPLGSDGSEGEKVLSSAQSTPAKTISSVGKSNENEGIQKEKLTRSQSNDSDPGYREGPPPLDSEDEGGPVAIENGVQSQSEEDIFHENDNVDHELSEGDKEVIEDQEVDEEVEDDEHADLIQGSSYQDESPEDDDSLASDELPEDEQRMLRTESLSEDDEQPEESASLSPETEQAEADETTQAINSSPVMSPSPELLASPAMSATPEMSASPEPAPAQFPEKVDLSDSEGSERIESPKPMIRYDVPEVLSDPDVPLLDDQPSPVDILPLTPKKNKLSLKEKGNVVEKSSLLNSDSSEDEESTPIKQEQRLELSDSESETNEVPEPVKPVEPVRKPVLKDSDGKFNVNQTRTNKSPSSKKEETGPDTKKRMSGRQSVEIKTQIPKEQKPRETLSKSSKTKQNNEDLSKKIKVAKPSPAAIVTETRRKHAPGLAVKDERPKPTKKPISQHTKHAPGLAVKEDSSKPTEKDNRIGKIRETKTDDRKTKTSIQDTHSRKQRHEVPTKQKSTITTRKDGKNEIQKKDKSPVGNGEVVKKIKQRPKISKSKYAAVATEDDFDDEPEEIPQTKTEKTRTESRGTHREPARHEKKDRHHVAKGSSTHGHKHDRSKHVWLCRDDEIHKLIAQKASLLKEYESGSLAGRNVFSGQKSRHRKEEDLSARSMPDVGFAGSGRTKNRSARPISEVLPDREPYTSRKRENRRSLQHRYSGSSSEDDDERTNKQAGNLRAEKAASGGTFSVGMASRNFSKRDGQSDSDHEETCEYCAAEKAAQKAQERDLAWEGPHHPRNLLLGVVYTAKYLGSSQIMSPQSPDRNVRMQQAQEAVGRIKVPEGEDQPTTDVDLFISTERIKVVNSTNKDIMMDHALRTVSFIADIGDVLVLMARRPPGDSENVLETKPSASQILASVAKAETDPKMIKITCHVFEAPEAQIIAKSIGQAFNVAYQEFLRTNGISEDSIEDAEYNCVLEAQKILGEDLTLLSDASKSREVVVNKKPGESLGVMIVESGWGSMIPTAIIAHLAKEGPAAKSGRLNVGDQILAVNNTSLVGLPLPECQTIIKNSRPGTKVVMKVVSCPPTVQVVVNRPDTKYQLGFSVQNGMICSLMRGSIAERGGVRVGHRIIEINNESVVATSHQHIVDLLASTTGEIRMKTMPASMYRLLVGLDTPQYI